MIVAAVFDAFCWRSLSGSSFLVFVKQLLVAHQSVINPNVVAILTKFPLQSMSSSGIRLSCLQLKRRYLTSDTDYTLLL